MLPVESAVLERERTNMREKEERRMRGRPTEVVKTFLASWDGLRDPGTRLDLEPRLPELGNLMDPGIFKEPSLVRELSVMENLGLECREG